MTELISLSAPPHDVVSSAQPTPVIASSTPSSVRGDSNTNAIIDIAQPLIVIMVQIKKSTSLPDINELRVKMINEIQLFEQKLVTQRFDDRTVASARYCLCTALDEAILSTAWGTQTAWVQHSLLSYFHNETWGGERFYLILDTLAQEPRGNLAILEFLYLLLSLGFEGKYFENNGLIREEIRHRLHTRLKNVKGKSQRQLAINTRDLGVARNNQHQRRSLSWVGYVTAISLTVTLVLFNLLLFNNTSSISHAYSKIGHESAITAYSQLIDRAIVTHHSTGSE